LLETPATPFKWLFLATPFKPTTSLVKFKATYLASNPNFAFSAKSRVDVAAKV